MIFSLLILFIIFMNFQNSKCYISPKSWLETLLIKELSDFQKGQRIMTGMFREFDRICSKYNLRYWCTGGTFIGVVRHGGWIPWDGDIDVAMLDTDYKKFQKIVQKELPKDMWFQDKTVDSHYSSSIGKMRYLNAHYSDDNSRKWHNGIQIDIFIFKKKGNKITGPKENYSIYNNSVTTLNVDDVFPLKRLPFEGVPVYVINKYKEYSINNFGYFPPKYPPISKQKCHEGRISFNIPDWIKEKYPKLYL